MAGHPYQRFGGETYSQHGDDLFLLNVFDLLRIPKPSYLDIGAHHPSIISNTKLLYDRGSRGVNVEANPYLMEAFLRDRPEDTNLNLGVAAVPGKMPFYMSHRDGGRNTFDPKERDIWVAEGHPVSEVLEIEVVTINEIIQMNLHGWPDLLTMDVEGLDYEILESANFYTGLIAQRARPKVICVEVRKHDTEKVKKLLKTKGYTCLCRIIENLIFVETTSVDRLR